MCEYFTPLQFSCLAALSEAGQRRSSSLLLFGDFAPKPQIIVPSSCLTLLYHQVCVAKISPTLTIHKKRHCHTWCWCPVLIMQCSRIVHAKLLALSAPNTRPWARPEAGEWALSGGEGSISWLGAEAAQPGTCRARTRCARIYRVGIWVIELCYNYT